MVISTDFCALIRNTKALRRRSKGRREGGRKEERRREQEIKKETRNKERKLPRLGHIVK